ncbi:hypothetical protein [Lentzea albida]|uniref:Uncharacterized protein n=1 Tax=Lentzea albida TaxID=65499 RepID=A0A1H9KBU4_9PSEU|nr:hypothetical protein [Lentzea albida]SEQ96335.1 hypothetical protein SAMN04488000_105256 [Lentzea albida]
MSVVLLAPALALLGNIATNTVEVSWRWWPPTVWVLVGLLVAGTVWVEVRRQGAPAEDDGEPVVVTPEFVDVDYVREYRTGKLLPASGFLLRLVVESRSRRRVVLRALRAEVVAREPVSGHVLPHLGKIRTRAFRLDLGGDRPVVTARKRDDFPLWVDAGEPEVIDVQVHNTDGKVEWRLFLDWTVNGRSGTAVIDAGGRPYITAQRPGG